MKKKIITEDELVDLFFTDHEVNWKEVYKWVDEPLRWEKLYLDDGTLIYEGFTVNHKYVCRLNDEIPGCKLPVGMSVVFNMRENEPTEEQKQAIFNLICSSPYRQYEYMIFEFMNSDYKDGNKSV